MKLHDIMSNGAGVLKEGNHYTVGPWLTFDPYKESMVGDHAEDANFLLKDENRTGFQVPTLANV